MRSRTFFRSESLSLSWGVCWFMDRDVDRMPHIFFESMLTFAEPFRVGRVSCGFRFAGPPCVTAGVLPRGNISELSQVSRTLSYASNLPDPDSPHDPLAHPTCLPECSSELLESVPVCHRGRSASALAAERAN